MNDVGRMKFSARSLCILLSSLFLISTCFTQEKIVSRRLPGFPYVSFAYRPVGHDSATGKNKMEWVFFNRTDSTLSFTYRLGSSPDDTVVGRITLLPGEKSFAGWLFCGDTLRSVDCRDVEFKTAR